MTLTHDEMIEILEEIARESTNAAARIAAIKVLREIDDGKPASGRSISPRPVRRAPYMRARRLTRAGRRPRDGSRTDSRSGAARRARRDDRADNRTVRPHWGATGTGLGAL